MLSRSLFAASLLALSSLAAVGCAANTDDTTDEDTVAESSDDLTATAQSFVGKYYSHRAEARQFARLTLNANGTYTASVDISDVAMCITSPCLGPESGTWNASKSNGKLRLRLRAQGQSSRWYDASKSGAELTLTRSGKSQTLYSLGQNSCLDDSDCSSADTCSPRMCLMYCALNDPFCCGPSTCQPKNPPPLKKICGGLAGIACDAGEECVDDPTDGCDPKKGGADCSGICQPKPAGVTCGNTTCASGEVCCNPLWSMCTKPGQFCIQ